MRFGTRQWHCQHGLKPILRTTAPYQFLGTTTTVWFMARGRRREPNLARTRRRLHIVFEIVLADLRGREPDGVNTPRDMLQRQSCERTLAERPPAQSRSRCRLRVSATMTFSRRSSPAMQTRPHGRHNQVRRSAVRLRRHGLGRQRLAQDLGQLFAGLGEQARQQMLLPVGHGAHRRRWW